MGNSCALRAACSATPGVTNCVRAPCPAPNVVSGLIDTVLAVPSLWMPSAAPSSTPPDTVTLVVAAPLFTQLSPYCGELNPAPPSCSPGYTWTPSRFTGPKLPSTQTPAQPPSLDAVPGRRM